MCVGLDSLLDYTLVGWEMPNYLVVSSSVFIYAGFEISVCSDASLTELNLFVVCSRYLRIMYKEIK